MKDERPLPPMGAEEGKRSVIGYMDGVEYDHELGNAVGGNKVYPSIEDLRESKKCLDQCGIVEVRVTGIRIIQKSCFDNMSEEEEQQQLELNIKAREEYEKSRLDNHKTLRHRRHLTRKATQAVWEFCQGALEDVSIEQEGNTITIKVKKSEP